MREMSSDDSDEDDVQEERRTYDLNRLRHFLLTSNAEQLAAKREKQDFYKRELVRTSFPFITHKIDNFLPFRFVNIFDHYPILIPIDYKKFEVSSISDFHSRSSPSFPQKARFAS